MERYDVLVVGAGPSGIATAVRLSQLDRELSDRTLVIERERLPREKLCGGGVTFFGLQLLEDLGLRVDVPNVPIHNVIMKFEQRAVRFPMKNALLVTQRSELDASLVAQARKRGVRVTEDCAFEGLRPVDGGVEVMTSQGTVFARVVVAADGAKSVVRRKAKIGTAGAPSRISRLLEVLTPEHSALTREFVANEAVFDFSAVPDGVQGYYWDFPSLKNGEAFMNRGLFDARVRPDRPNANLKEHLRGFLRERDRVLHEADLEGAPERWYDTGAPIGNRKVMLVGDAAGIEPLLGEGIAWSLEYGQLAGTQLVRWFRRGDDIDVSAWTDVVRSNRLGKQLALRVRLGRAIYGVRSRSVFRLGWPVLECMMRLQAWQMRRSGEMH